MQNTYAHIDFPAGKLPSGFRTYRSTAFDPIHEVSKHLSISLLTLLYENTTLLKHERFLFGIQIARQTGASKLLSLKLATSVHFPSTEFKNTKNQDIKCRIKHGTLRSPSNYPLVNIQKNMERSTIFDGKTHYFNGHGFNSKLLT